MNKRPTVIVINDAPFVPAKKVHFKMKRKESIELELSITDVASLSAPQPAAPSNCKKMRSPKRHKKKHETLSDNHCRSRTCLPSKKYISFAEYENEHIYTRSKSTNLKKHNKLKKKKKLKKNIPASNKSKKPMHVISKSQPNLDINSNTLFARESTQEFDVNKVKKMLTSNYLQSYVNEEKNSRQTSLMHLKLRKSDSENIKEDDDDDDDDDEENFEAVQFNDNEPLINYVDSNGLITKHVQLTKIKTMFSLLSSRANEDTNTDLCFEDAVKRYEKCYKYLNAISNILKLQHDPKVCIKSPTSISSVSSGASAAYNN